MIRTPPEISPSVELTSWSAAWVGSARPSAHQPHVVSVGAGLRGEGAPPFVYRDPGMMAVIGRNAAVAHVFGRDLRGFPAWVLWALVHIAKLVGFRNRMLVLVNWLWNYLLYERAVRLILPTEVEGSSSRRGPSAG